MSRATSWKVLMNTANIFNVLAIAAFSAAMACQIMFLVDSVFTPPPPPPPPPPPRGLWSYLRMMPQ